MAIDFSELQDVDLTDLTTWPEWFKVAMTFVVFLALLYGGYHFLIGEQLRELNKLQVQEETLKKTFLDRKAKAINLPLYREQMIEIQRDFMVLIDQLPDKSEVPELLVDITQAGLSRGLEFLRFKPEATRDGDFYVTLPISLSVKGSFHQLGLFISDLATLPRIVTLGNLTVNGEPSGILNVSAEIKTYRYQDEFNDLKDTSENKRVRKVRE